MPAELDARLAVIIDELVDRYAIGPVSAASLSGSFARGDADALSDLDLRLYSDLPLEDVVAEQLAYRDGRLISVSYHTFRGESWQLTNPPSAVFAVDPLRTLKPLRDRESKLARLQREAQAFRWDAISGAAHTYATRVVYEQAEVVHKIVGSLTNATPLRTAMATMELVQELTLAMAVARHMLIVSDRTYLPQMYAEVGETSGWVVAHRAAIGVTDDPGAGTTYVDRGIGALHLYGETAQALERFLSEDQRTVTGEVQNIIAGFNYVKA